MPGTIASREGGSYNCVCKGGGGGVEGGRGEGEHEQLCSYFLFLLSSFFWSLQIFALLFACGHTSKYSFHSLLLRITSVVSFPNVGTCFWSRRASHQCYIGGIRGVCRERRRGRGGTQYSFSSLRYVDIKS